jgi:hypothetical protein
MHAGREIIEGLDARFDRTLLAEGPYFFVDLRCTEDEERAAIDSGAIRATGVHYTGVAH